MKNFIKNTVIYKIFFFLRKNLRILYSTKSRNRFLWNLNKGDDKLSFDYKLNEESLVFVVGAFEGDYLGKLHQKFQCRIYGFEPIDDYFSILINKFKKYQNIKLFNFGLSDKNEKVKFSKIGESSSAYKSGEQYIEAYLKSVTQFIEEHNIDLIDLVYMNIEGGEYSVLNQLIEEGLIKKINHLQVQYHKVDSKSRMYRKKINTKLKDSHIRKFNYPFIWERWDLKI